MMTSYVHVLAFINIQDNWIIDSVCDHHHTGDGPRKRNSGIRDQTTTKVLDKANSFVNPITGLHVSKIDGIRRP
ncbi:hypothetical protein KSP40_PGU016674 [Platanthera guangdongensis]|uniref:Uncharacterized protein n=1 Tax=Platanthera guangdongensis TaxID=2320717 RepID=A0ABR2MYQ6_9ASPA